MKVPEALEYLAQEEEQKLIDMDSVARAAVERVEQAGIIFIDEIDKIAGREGGHGPDVSREGVQRDILPIVEGTTVNTKYGMVRTDHILFIAAGAFHVSKPSDLIPELQGRFPIRVELEALGKDEFVRILTEPRSALVKQYIALMDTEGIELDVHRRRDSPDRRLRDDRQRAHREHRRAAAAHGDGEAARRDLVRGARSRREARRSSTRPTSTRMLADIVKNEDLVPVHSVSKGDRESLLAARRARRCRAAARKGPPLPPLVRMPAAPANFAAERRGEPRRCCSFTVPAANTDGTRPANIERVDVYALTSPAPRPVRPADASSAR